MEDLEEPWFEDFENYSLEYYFQEADLEEKVHMGIVHWVSVGLYCLAFVLGVPGNATVIWFTGFKWKKTVATLWFLNLAIADLIFVLCMPLYISYVAMNFHWPFGILLCKNALIVIIFVWLLASLIAGPALYFRDVVKLNNHVLCYNNFHENDPDLRLMRHHALTWVKFIVGYLFPLITMSICYSCLIFQVKKRNIVISSKHFWTVLAVVIAFLICWTPYHLFSIWELMIHHNSYFFQVLEAGIPISTALAFLNSCLNPILYVLISKKFQVRLRSSVAEILKHTLWEVSCSGTVSEQLRNSETKNLCLMETAQ
ncbi:PREDICTED: G-protein coupled receptor 1 [Elephantulus edwardii]|uniref:G-protein coupled receptor 1 n=1 Tax=Elephantulus edwardii TaxID=28737 RepID=UPI0003F0709D|nr:PREDICTED: G-protein coupled receptor 1 [Elephantulus edwardii]